MDPQTELLLQRSAEDEATMLLEGIPAAAFGFHAQQAIEKLLKALIAARGGKYPRIHDLEKLDAMPPAGRGGLAGCLRAARGSDSVCAQFPLRRASADRPSFA